MEDRQRTNNAFEGFNIAFLVTVQSHLVLWKVKFIFSLLVIDKYVIFFPDCMFVATRHMDYVLLFY